LAEGLDLLNNVELTTLVILDVYLAIDWYNQNMNFDGLEFLIVGSGFFGSVLAERVATVLGKKVIIVEKRGHIGGNSYSGLCSQTGIEEHLYGAHIFHTSNKRVWDYIRSFSDFTNYQHRVFTEYKSVIYPLPISLATINAFYKKQLRPYEVEAFMQNERANENIVNPTNLEEMAISLIGRPLYEAFIKGYTKKQWDKDPRFLPANIITRLPVRKNYNNNYFNDSYQGLPQNGYFKLFENILSNPKIEVKLNTNFFEIKEKIPSSCHIIFTGPIDQYFNYKFGALEWRGLRFVREVLNYEDFQGTAVMNYADELVPYTRIHEFRHFHPERVAPANKTLVVREYPQAWKVGEDPYYPMGTKENLDRYELYRREAASISNLHIGGRMGQYCYLDMDKTILLALELFDKIRVRYAT